MAVHKLPQGKGKAFLDYFRGQGLPVEVDGKVIGRLVIYGGRVYPAEIKDDFPSSVLHHPTIGDVRSYKEEHKLPRTPSDAVDVGVILPNEMYPEAVFVKHGGVEKGPIVPFRNKLVALVNSLSR